MDENLKKEFLVAVNDGIKANVKEAVGAEFAEQVEKTVQALAAERAVTGRDITGVSSEAKVKFIQDLRERAPYLGASDQAGGYLIPTEIYAGILRIAATTGIVARDAKRFTLSTDQIDIPRYTGAVMQGAYIGEDTEGTETQNDLGVARIFVKQWITVFRISNILLADANVSVADWLMSMAAEGLAYRLDREGFRGGSFAGSPFVGLLSSPDVTVQTMATTNTGFDKLSLIEASDAIGALDTSMLNGAAFYFHRTVWAKLRSRSTAGIFEYGQTNLGRFQRESGIQAVGEILGYPVYTTDVLPAFSASAISTKFGVFGNISQALAWGDRGPMEIAKSGDATVGGKSLFLANQTALRFTHRHGISVALPAAAVVLKTSAS